MCHGCSLPAQLQHTSLFLSTTNNTATHIWMACRAFMYWRRPDRSTAIQRLLNRLFLNRFLSRLRSWRQRVDHRFERHVSSSTVDTHQRQLNSADNHMPWEATDFCRGCTVSLLESHLNFHVNNLSPSSSHHHQLTISKRYWKLVLCSLVWSRSDQPDLLGSPEQGNRSHAPLGNHWEHDDDEGIAARGSL